MSRKRSPELNDLPNEGNDDLTNKYADQQDFQRAGASHLQARRVVKTRFTLSQESSTRNSDNANTSSSTGTNQNPFASIQLTPASTLSTQRNQPLNVPAEANGTNNTIISAARNSLEQISIKTILEQHQSYQCTPCTGAIKFYLARHKDLDKEWYRCNPTVETAVSSNANIPHVPPPASEVASTNKPFGVAAATTTNTNPYGNFAPVAAPMTNPFGATSATPQQPISNENEDGAVEEVNDPNDETRRDNDPDWRDIGEYEKVHFYKQGDDGAVVKICSGTLRIQAHTSQPNFSRMILRNLNGSKVLINMRIDRNMTFTLKMSEKLSEKPKNASRILFKGMNSGESKHYTFTVRCEESVAQRLHAQLTDITPK